MRRRHVFWLSTLSVGGGLLALLGGAGTWTGCASDRAAIDPGNSYFSRTIEPILRNSCARQTTGCHVSSERGDAVGNLDVTSFLSTAKRYDLLVTYGPYSAPGLLTKVGGPQALTVSTLDGPITIQTDIRHAAGAGIDVTSEGYATLRRWMDGGASQDNLGPSTPRLKASGDCRKTIPTAPGFDPAAALSPDFATFKDKVQPVLKKSCGAGSCHGSDVGDLVLTCGDDDAQLRWNHWIVSQYVAERAESSEIVRRPLEPSRGGVFHEGGVVFDGPENDDYKTLLEWVKTRGASKVGVTEEGLRFFANRVQPTLVRKGCMFLGCHSPSMFHDLRLRGGAGGLFSLVATRSNHEMSRKMLALESADPNASRLIAKNLQPYDADIDPGGRGDRHRGGALLDDVPGVETPSLDACKTFDVEKGDLSKIPAYCIIATWHQKERAALIASGGLQKDVLTAIAYVSRPPNKDIPQAFDTFRPGGELHLAKASMNPAGEVTLGADEVVNTKCGLGAGVEVRKPAVSWDGTKIAFAARSSVDTPLAIYVMNADGSGCAKEPKIAAHETRGNGILIHDFDPAFAPDGRLVFASTRGAIDQSDTDYKGPSRTPAGLFPNANLYVVDPAGIRQLTWLLGQEFQPSFMHDGRIIMTAEKRAPGFYQLAGRRQNMDGADYHPLFAQRSASFRGSDKLEPAGGFGYEQFTEIVELADRTFAGILSDHDAIGGSGGLAVVNRSLGPDQSDRDPNDRFYLRSTSFPDRTATGKKGAGTSYRGPASLPGRSMMASVVAGDPTANDGTFELVQVFVPNGNRRPLVKVTGKAIVDSVAVYAKGNFGVFASRLDEPNGATRIEPGLRDADIRVLDLPMISTLLFGNTRVARGLDPDIRGLGILESLPPPPETTSLDSADSTFVSTDAYGKLWVKRRRLGVVNTLDDGSLGVRIPGGIPVTFEIYKDVRAAAVATQREEISFAPGERLRFGFRRELFDAQCGGCHGSVGGRETDVHLRPDVLTGASSVSAMGLDPANLMKAPGDRGTPFGAK